MRTAASTSSVWCFHPHHAPDLCVAPSRHIPLRSTSSSLITCHSDQAWLGCGVASNRMFVGAVARRLASQPASGISPYSRWDFFPSCTKWRTVGWQTANISKDQSSARIVDCLFASRSLTYRRKVTEESHLPGRTLPLPVARLSSFRIASASILIFTHRRFEGSAGSTISAYTSPPLASHSVSAGVGIHVLRLRLLWH